MLEDVYASSDVNIVMMMFFEIFYSEKFLSSQAGLEHTTFWSPVRCSNHWAIFTSELAYTSSNNNNKWY